MRLLLRSPWLPAACRPLGARRLVLAMAAAAGVSLALLVALAPPAGAVVVEPVAGRKIGVQPHNASTLGEGGSPETFSNPHGNPVLHSVHTYAIYWDPKDLYHGDWQHVINTFLENLGVAGGSLENVFAVDAQYTDKSNRPAADASSFAGAYTDTNAYPTAGCTDPNSPGDDALWCLTDTQIRAELQNFVISQHGLAKGMSSIFYLLTPPRVTVCADAGATVCSSNTGATNSLCSYHSDISETNAESGDENTLLYAVIPWTAGGMGDPHLPGADRIEAFDCQDGGFDPSTKPAEQKETKPREEEPNQLACPTSDGGCDTGLADLIINQIAVEQQNTITDPLLNAWQDSGAPHNEATDECRNEFALVLGGSSAENEESGAGNLHNQVLNGGEYYLNDAFNLAAYKLSYPGVPCLTGAALEPRFTAPTPVHTSELVGFDGMESDIALGGGTDYTAGGSPQATYATYTWNFGDGSSTVSGYAPGAPVCSSSWLSPCAASVYHAYEYAGTYTVTLTVTDVGGNTAESTSLVTVTGTPRPGGSGGSGGSSGAAGSSSPSGSSAGSTTAAATSLPGPAATASALSRSLSSALGSGLVVRYSVSEQVAGHFEVMLAASVARKIGLHGPAATGLAKGTPAQIVIAKDLLVTTTGGHNTLKIKFAKSTAARLRRLHKVSLMLRLVVRNPSKSPASTSSVSNVTLIG